MSSPAADPDCRPPSAVVGQTLRDTLTTFAGGRLSNVARIFEREGVRLVDETLGVGADGAGGSDAARHLVFLHGWRLNRDSLRGIGILFENAFRVHLIDLPGFGDLPAPPPDWDTLKYADLLQAYLAAHLSGPVVLIGHSFGGRVALRLAARRLPQIAGLVLMAVPGLPASGYSTRRLRRVFVRTLRRALASMRPLTGEAPLAWHTRRYGSADYLAAGELRSIFVKVVNEDLTESARTTNCPVLLVYGSDDTETPSALAFRYAALMNGRATIDLLPHHGHHLYAGTGAHLCAFKIRHWLSGLTPLDHHGG
jgi:pimeloyl-ACP methyl ester carboxylesterase